MKIEATAPAMTGTMAAFCPTKISLMTSLMIQAESPVIAAVSPMKASAVA